MEKKLRILFYSPHPTHDIVTEVGYATHQRETIEALRELGAEVLPVVLGGTSLEQVPYTDGKAISPTGIKKWIKKLIPRYIWVSLKDFLLLKHDKKAQRELLKGIQSFKPDLIYERSEYLQDSAVKPCKEFNIPYFVEVNAPFVQEMTQMEGSSIWTGLGHKKEKKKYHAANAIFVVSTVLKEFLVKQYCIDPEKIYVSPNRINIEHFTSKTNDPLSISLSFKDPSFPIVGFVGSILPHHHVEDLLSAFEKCLANGAKANLLIIGGGTLLQDLQSAIAQSPFKDNIQFTGKIPHAQVPSYVQKMDITVMPGSNWYGSPIKIFEYGILGKLVIAPNNGPVCDVMVSKQDGILIESGTEALYEALQFALQNPQKAIEMGENFKQKIKEKYTWEQAAKMILDEYKILINS